MLLLVAIHVCCRKCEDVFSFGYLVKEQLQIVSGSHDILPIYVLASYNSHVLLKMWQCVVSIRKA